MPRAADVGRLSGAGAPGAGVRTPGRAGAGRALAALAILAGCALLCACGGGTRQDASEPAAAFRMRVLRAHFPRLQAVARTTSLELEVQNTGLRTVPNVAVTINSFYAASRFPGLADAKRPIWVIEQGPGAIAHPPVESVEVSIPGGAQTVYVNTWALGRLAPLHAKRFVWTLVPVEPGTYQVGFKFSAGLAGKAVAVPSEGLLRGVLPATVAPRPPKRHVRPETGKVVPGPYLPGVAEKPSASS